MRFEFSTPQRRRFLIVAVCISIVLAGCAGWGANGPADGSNADQENSSDLENEQNNADESETTSDSSDTNSDSSTESQSTVESNTIDSSSNNSSSDLSDTMSLDSSNGSDSNTDPVDDSEGDTTADNESERGDGADTPNAETATDRNRTNSSNGTNGNDSDSDDPETYTLRVIADAPITIERTSDDATTTREPTDGSAEFTVLEGQYNIMADGYNGPMNPIGVSEDRTVTLQESGSITITVVDAETGDPIEGAEISGMCDLWYAGGDAYLTGNSNADGLIEAETITPTTCRYDTVVTADGYEDTSLGEINVPEDDGMTVELRPEDS